MDVQNIKCEQMLLIHSCLKVVQIPTGVHRPVEICCGWQADGFLTVQGNLMVSVDISCHGSLWSYLQTSLDMRVFCDEKGY